MTSVDYRICTNCVMDTSDSKIRFDARRRLRSLPDLLRTSAAELAHRTSGAARRSNGIATEIKKQGVGRDFDCIIGISGGVDSSYLTYLAKEKLGLRPLVFHVDAGWNSQMAVNNIEKLVDGLGLDLLHRGHRLGRDARPAARVLQVAACRTSTRRRTMRSSRRCTTSPSSTACKYILTGANYSTECVRKPHRVACTTHRISRAATRHPSALRHAPAEELPDHRHPTHKVYCRYVKGIRVVRPLNYVPYVKEEAMQLLRRNSAGSRMPRSTSSRASRASTRATGCRRSSATTRGACSSRA